MEDIDCAFRDRRKEIENDPRYLGASGGVTNSGLLNAIDGVTNSDGRIVIMTTNYIDQLDAALIRPGRVDRRFEFEDASDLQICGVFLKFFPRQFYRWSLGALLPFGWLLLFCSAPFVCLGFVLLLCFLLASSGCSWMVAAIFLTPSQILTLPLTFCH